MIKESIKANMDFVAESIRNTPLREHNGVYYQVYEDFFDSTFLRLLEGVQSDNVKLSKLAWQEDQNRRRVDYDESVSQTLQVFFHSSNIINALKQKFNLKDLRPNTTDIWFDWEGYQITPHLDGDYQISLQIYLNNQQQPPTVFMDKIGEQYKVFDSATYRSNCGYALLTEGPAYHAMEGPVESGERKSVFARFE